MFNVKDFSDLLITQSRVLGNIRYPMFCEVVNNSYELINEVCFTTAVKRLLSGEYKEVAVLDSFDCAYYGSFDYNDLIEYMIERGIIYEI